IGINERAARDFLDALVALGMLERDDNGRYGNSPATDLYLDRNKPTYIGGLLESFNARHYGLWAALSTALRTGQPQCDVGAVSFADLYADRKSRDHFVHGMTAGARTVAQALATQFP